MHSIPVCTCIYPSILALTKRSTYARNEHGLRVVLDVPQKGVAEGQVATLYLGDWCLGCGNIDSAEFTDCL